VAPPSLSLTGRKDFAAKGYLQLRSAFYAKDDRPGPSEIGAPGATLLDLGGGWRIVPRLELRGYIRNLLNDTYYASPDPRFVLAPGRSASLTAAVDIF
jgi:outer membrane receptor protein involved in Fe transport